MSLAEELADFVAVQVHDATEPPRIASALITAVNAARAVLDRASLLEFLELQLLYVRKGVRGDPLHSEALFPRVASTEQVERVIRLRDVNI